MQGVKLSQILCRQTLISGRNRVALATEPKDWPTRALGGVCTGVLNDAITHRRAGHRAGTAGFLHAPCAFVVQKKEKAVLLDWASERGAENIADQFWSLVR